MAFEGVGVFLKKKILQALLVPKNCAVQPRSVSRKKSMLYGRNKYHAYTHFKEKTTKTNMPVPNHAHSPPQKLNDPLGPLSKLGRQCINVHPALVQG